MTGQNVSSPPACHHRPSSVRLSYIGWKSQGQAGLKQVETCQKKLQTAKAMQDMSVSTLTVVVKIGESRPETMVDMHVDFSRCVDHDSSKLAQWRTGLDCHRVQSFITWPPPVPLVRGRAGRQGWTAALGADRGCRS